MKKLFIFLTLIFVCTFSLFAQTDTLPSLDSLRNLLDQVFKEGQLPTLEQISYLNETLLAALSIALGFIARAFKIKLNLPTVVLPIIVMAIITVAIVSSFGWMDGLKAFGVILMGSGIFSWSQGLSKLWKKENWKNPEVETLKEELATLKLQIQQPK